MNKQTQVQLVVSALEFMERHEMIREDQEYTCSCCGYLVFSEPPGSSAICPICFWEDDLVQVVFPDCDIGPNSCSLIEAQLNYQKLGACEVRSIPHMRRPKATELRDPTWSPVNPALHQFLRFNFEPDHERWKNIYFPEVCLYYWRENYLKPK